MMEIEAENYCNKCPTILRGMCCYFSYFDGTDNFITHPCLYLSKKTKRCKIYKKRFKINPQCLSVQKGLHEGSFPEECPYVKNSNIVPIRPYKIYIRGNLIEEKLIELKVKIKNGIKKRRFQKVQNS
ncbi:hypothetical protein LCGC14_0567000 [marine sediment metagenome]|uniref:Uncharacterized protein n=1 Tax=marine sediment metagenome TaxID=412755 RepID=A0A0F9UTL8_9ZZZZ